MGNLSNGYTVLEGTMNLVQALYLNHQVQPFDNVLVRQAMCYAVDVDAMLADNAAMLRSERTGMDVMVLTPGAVSAEAMLGAVCLPVNCTADQLTVAAGCSQMLELVRQAKQSVVPADAPVELRLAASQTTLTDHDTGAAAEFFYGLVRSAEAAS